MFKLQPRNLSNLLGRSEPDPNHFLDPKERNLDFIRQTLLPGEMIASEKKLPLLHVYVTHGLTSKDWNITHLIHNHWFCMYRKC